MRDKYGTGQDKYCYPDTGVLINLLGISDANELEEAEIAFSSARYQSYQSQLTSLEDFTFKHLKQLHYVLFQDIYPWAGKTREINISKGNTLFCTCSRIDPEASKLFSRIPELEACTNTEQVVKTSAELFCELNLLHPFREGNGRVLRFFFEEMLFVIGYQITWPPISQQQWTDANIAGVDFNLAPLERIFGQAISPL